MTEEEAAKAVQKHLHKLMVRYFGKTTPEQEELARMHLAKTLQDLRTVGLLPPQVSIEESEHVPGMFKIDFEMTEAMLDNYLWNRQMIDGLTAEEMLADLKDRWVLATGTWEDYVLMVVSADRSLLVRRPAMIHLSITLSGEESEVT